MITCELYVKICNIIIIICKLYVICKKISNTVINVVTYLQHYDRFVAFNYYWCYLDVVK